MEDSYPPPHLPIANARSAPVTYPFPYTAKMVLRTPDNPLTVYKHDKLTIFFEPFFCYETPVTDHCNTWQLKVLLTEADQFPQIRSALDNERLAPSKIDLLHT